MTNKKAATPKSVFTEQPYEVAILANRLQMVHQQHQNSEVAHCGILIKTGSRHEEKGQEGYAHFMEHMLFKGTSKRKPFHILSRIDAVGGEINAYTSKEETFVYASFLRSNYERAIELLSDILFHSTLPEKEIEKEKEVVIDEIDSYLDTPAEQIFDDFEDELFKFHPIGGNILGTKKSIKSLTHSRLNSFYQANYSADRMIFSSVGDIPSSKVFKLVEQYFGDKLSKQKAGNQHVALAVHHFNHNVKKSVNQCHGVLGGYGFQANHPNRRALVLMMNMLGGPALNNRLNLNIRERYGITYHLEANYTPYLDTGIFTIYFGTDAKNLERSIALIHKELDRFCQQPLSAQALRSAKKQLIGQLALANESKLAGMQALAKSLSYFNRIDTLDEVIDGIEAITSAEMQRVAQEIFKPDNISSLLYVS